MRKRPLIRRLAACITAAAVCFLCIASPAFALFMKEKDATVQSLTVAEADSTQTAKFALVFEHTDSYLYRLGNCDSISLGSLFEEAGETAVDDETVTVTVTPQTTANGAAINDADASLSATVTYDTDHWEDGTIQFTKYTGVVAITICDETSEELTLLAEVVSGYNFEDGETVSTKSGYHLVLLADCAIADSSTLTIAADYALYGNGFTLDVSEGSISALGIVSLSGTIDNTQVVGDVYTDLGDSYGSDYYAATVIMYSGSTISNSYISGSRAAVRVASDATIKDTTIEGGYYSNIDIRDGDLVLEGDVVTINEPVTTGSTTVMGFGIIFNYEGSDDATLTVNGTLTQYNWVCASDKSYFYDDYQSYITSYIKSGDYLQSYDGTTYANLAIISLNSAVGASSVSCDQYECFSASSGYLWSWGSDYSMTASDLLYRSDVNSDYTAPADAWTPDAEMPSLPAYTWSYPSAYNSSLKTIYAEIDSGDTYTLEDVSSYLTAAKNGNTLANAVTIESPSDAENAAVYDDSTDTATFTDGGIYTICYTLTDPMIYDPDAVRTGDTVTYTKSLTLTLSVNDTTISAPEFTFTAGDTTYSGDDVTTVEAGGLTYVMPDVSSTSDDIGSKTVSGTTIYYPIVEGLVDGSSLTDNLYRYYPLFTGITIKNYTDADGSYVTYDSTYDTEASDGSLTVDGLTWVGTSGDNAYNGTWGDYKVYDGYYCRATGVMKYSSWNVDALVIVEYSFTAGNGTIYYYYIGYQFEEEGGCFPTGTQITLADGTQTAVENLSGEEKLLVFDHETGTYTTSSILFIDRYADDTYAVITLSFSDGSQTQVIYEHAYFDLTRNQYVYINANTLDDYIGDSFALDAGDDTLTSAVLTDVSVEEEYTGCYSLVTAYQLDYFVDGFLSIPGGIDGLFNIFEYDENLMYDAEKKAADIETYGLFTYDDLSDYVSEEMFDVFNGAYLKVSIGKGYLTLEGIIRLASRYGAYFE